MAGRLLLIDGEPRRSRRMMEDFRRRGWVSFQVANVRGAMALLGEERFRLSLMPLPIRAGQFANEVGILRSKAPGLPLGAVIHGDHPELRDDACRLGVFSVTIDEEASPDIEELLRHAGLAEENNVAPTPTRLLAVCPDIDAAMTLKEAGRIAGVRVTCVESFAMAREAIDREGAAGLLIDVLCRGGGGVETIRLARSLWPGLPVIAIAGDIVEAIGASTALRAARKLGAHGVLVKPLALADAAVLLAETLGPAPKPPSMLSAAS